MPARNTALKPDANGRYHPYSGWKLGEDGQRRQRRFNLGTDRKEAERRMARLRELWAENEKVAGELGDIRRLRLLAIIEDRPSDRFEQGPHAFLGRRRTGGAGA